jgi:arsenate reductase-like glutaredoxin family protein
MEVQIFGTQKNTDTRKALRFFKERRVKVHLVDLKTRAPSKGELTRFVQRFGVEAILDRDSRRFAELGLGAAHYSPERWFDLLLDDPFLLTLPLVRHGNLLTVGLAEKTWREWIGR